MRKFGTKIRSANNNSPKPSVFDINRLTRKPFELSRLQGFVDGHDDIFDVLADKPMHSTMREKHQI